MALVLVGIVCGATGLADEDGFAGAALQFVSPFTVALTIFSIAPLALNGSV